MSSFRLLLLIVLSAPFHAAVLLAQPRPVTIDDSKGGLNVSCYTPTMSLYYTGLKYEMLSRSHAAGNSNARVEIDIDRISAISRELPLSEALRGVQISLEADTAAAKKSRKNTRKKKKDKSKKKGKQKKGGKRQSGRNVANGFRYSARFLPGISNFTSCSVPTAIDSRHYINGFGILADIESGADMPGIWDTGYHLSSPRPDEILPETTLTCKPVTAELYKEAIAEGIERDLVKRGFRSYQIDTRVEFVQTSYGEAKYPTSALIGTSTLNPVSVDGKTAYQVILGGSNFIPCTARYLMTIVVYSGDTNKATGTEQVSAEVDLPGLLVLPEQS